MIVGERSQELFRWQTLGCRIPGSLGMTLVIEYPTLVWDVASRRRGGVRWEDLTCKLGPL
jgi:hypothetical protein